MVARGASRNTSEKMGLPIMQASDPFYHHPELRDLINDPENCFFRTLTTAKMAEMAREKGIPRWWYSDAEREAMRAEALSEHGGGDLWVFAYGSLMWDPGLYFEEVRRAWLPNHARRLILKDIYGARGTAEKPGLMAALDRGEPGCHGLAFRISEAQIETETEALWRREGIGPAYRPVFVEADIDGAVITTLTFIADHDAELIDSEMSHDEQISYLVSGTGFAGSSIDYLRNLVSGLGTVGIRDAELDELLAKAESQLIEAQRS